MTIMTLTALDAAHDGHLLDITAMRPEDTELIHGRRALRLSHIHPVCRHCQRTVHLHRGSSTLFYWQHNPGQADGCALAEVRRGGESMEHLAAKATIVAAHRALSGWTVVPEHRFEWGGELVIADVFAEHARPDPEHRFTRLYEVQLSRQSSGDFEARTAERDRCAGGATTVWTTPYLDEVGGRLSLITDPTAKEVVNRVWDDTTNMRPLPPLALGDVVRGLARDRPFLYWAKMAPPARRGVERTWGVYATRPLATSRPPSRAGGRGQRSSYRGVEDREGCGDPDRAPVVLRLDVAPIDTTDWTDAQWDGRARMADARQAADVPLDSVDIAAMQRRTED